MQPYHLPVVAEDAEINPVLLRVGVQRDQLCDLERDNSLVAENHVAVEVIAQIEPPIIFFADRRSPRPRGLPLRHAKPTRNCRLRDVPCWRRKGRLTRGRRPVTNRPLRFALLRGQEELVVVHPTTSSP